MFSIRVRIISLVTGALVLGLGLSQLASTALMVEDKVSYLYDHNFAKVSELSTAIESRIERIEVFSRVAGGLPPALAGNFFDEKLHPAGVAALAFFQLQDDGAAVIRMAFGRKLAPAELQSHLSRQGWTGERLPARALLGVSAEGLLPLCGVAADSEGRPLRFLALLKPELDPGPGQEREFELLLADSVGQVLFRRSTLPAISGRVPAAASLDALVRDLWQGGFGSGARERSLDGREYIVGHRQLLSQRLLLVRLVPKELAYSATTVLKRRLLLLGGSVFVLSLGLTLLLARRLTRRIRELWLATRRVGAGDFSVGVEERPSPGDEMSALAAAFNLMAGRIRGLLQETAIKARMEKELETAQYVQKHFFPVGGFEHPNLSLAGLSLPASECAGDWWNYARLGDRVLIVMGDVMGHGVSAALVTASVHSAYSIFVEELARSAPAEVPLAPLVARLNSAVLAAAGTDSSMSLFVCAIDLRSGLFRAVDQGHCPAVLLGGGSGEISLLERSGGSLLGMSEFLPGKETRRRMAPGEAIFLHTDGLFEPRARDKMKISKTQLLERIQEGLTGGRPGGSEASRVIQSIVEEHWGTAPGERLDDITFAVVAIPPEARWAGEAGST
ncbi:MAG: SpoIIE family protein phosphatase [Oligoflexia bacterium]|nr:SpoIIE family protein phosphatase [Oligoflexia bacterium]